MRAQALLAAVIAVTAAADREMADDKPIHAFGKDHPDCVEWTDGCIVCKTADDGPACSITGPACVPGAKACRARR